MRKTTLFLFLVFFACLGWAQIPDVEVVDINKRRISLTDLQGEKLTVIDFWATWCKPCVSAIPKLNSIHKEFASQGVNFIGVNVDGPRNQAKVKPFARSLNITYPILLDPDQNLVTEFNVNAFPTLIVLNKDGKELFVHEGFNPGDESIIKSELEKLLKE